MTPYILSLIQTPARLSMVSPQSNIVSICANRQNVSFVHLSLPENQPTFGYQGKVYVLTVSKIGELDVKRMTKIGLPQLDKWHKTVDS